MILKKLYLKNFRAYKEITILFDKDFNVIVGKNDIGKSTILEALAIYFEHETIKIDISDLCKDADDSKIIIGCAFEIDKQKKYNIDSSPQATLEEEFLLNREGLLEIWKEWDCSKSSLGKCSVCFKAYYFLQEFIKQPLICLKNADLKMIYDERKLDTCSGKKTNAQLRAAIYKDLASSDKEEFLIDTDREDSKKVWGYLKEEIPLFFLFQSDRSNQDSDKDVQSPLKIITKKAVDDVKKELDDITNTIKDKIDEVAKQTIEKLKEMAPEVAQHLKANIVTKNWDSLFSFSFNDDRGIPINKRGSGVRRLILLNYFRAEAERNNVGNRNVIYSIEEPETSQHPDHQTMLFDALRKLSDHPKNQVIITTHTPELAKRASEENLIFIKKELNDEQPRLVSDVNTKMKEIADTLGVLPYLRKVVVCLEGQHDIDFLETINVNIPELKAIIDLNQVPLIPMIGGNLKNWIQKDYLKEVNAKEYHLYDKDSDNKYAEDVDKVNARNNGSKAKLTGFLMMENYCPPSLIEGRFNIKFDDEEKKTWADVNIIDLILNRSLFKKAKEIKYIINNELSRSIKRDHLKNEMNCWDEVIGWFKDIRELIDAH